MNKKSKQNRHGLSTTLMVAAAVLTATITVPTPAKADPSLTAIAVVGGAAIIGTMLWTNRDKPYAQASSTNPGTPPAYVTQPYPAISPPYTNGAVIYSSVTPTAQTTPAAVQPPVVYQMAPAPVAYYSQPTPVVQMTMPVQYAQPQQAPAQTMQPSGKPGEPHSF
ncbi:MAG: hypothetical protein HQL93_06170 [Magnetococcales bacterium]|nr:hypothetical protein [Magnetococcales bacterium]